MAIVVCGRSAVNGRAMKGSETLVNSVCEMEWAGGGVVGAGQELVLMVVGVRFSFAGASNCIVGE